MKKAPKFFTTPKLRPADAERIATILDGAEASGLASRIRWWLRHDQKLFEAEIEHLKAATATRAAITKRLADRAKNHTLTKRQAQCLASIRAGSYARMIPYSYTKDDGQKMWRFRYQTSMGGAVSRMVETLISEGLLSTRDKLTAAGRTRLTEWEAKHGEAGPQEPK